MAYFADGSPYTYWPNESATNVGWLDAAADFPRGTVDTDFLCQLKNLCRFGVNRTRGYHICNLCAQIGRSAMSTPTAVDTCGGERFLVGSAEIRVAAKDGLVYAAPDMIAHYVEVHNYLPPRGFIEAMLSQA